jgi:hypothetical protein
MRNDFVLTEKSNVILLKILKSALMVIVISTLVVYFNHFTTDFLYLLFSLGLIDFISLLILKSYKIIGKINFDSNEIVIELKNQIIQLPFQIIRRIEFVIQGPKRNSYRLSAIQPVGVNMANGTGNRMVIETESIQYELNIFLKNSFDENSLEFQIKRLGELGIKIDKRKLPAILGDSI